MPKKNEAPASFETALGELELWNKSLSSQLDAQLRERRKAFGRRIEAIRRIQDAAGGLDARIEEIDVLDANLLLVQGRLETLTRELTSPQALHAPDVILPEPVEA